MVKRIGLPASKVMVFEDDYDDEDYPPPAPVALMWVLTGWNDTDNFGPFTSEDEATAFRDTLERPRQYEALPIMPLTTAPVKKGKRNGRS